MARMQESSMLICSSVICQNNQALRMYRELFEGSSELRLLLCREQITNGRKSVHVVCACGIFVQHILDAVPIDKYFEMFKPGTGTDGGFVRLKMRLLPNSENRKQEGAAAARSCTCAGLCRLAPEAALQRIYLCRKGQGQKLGIRCVAAGCSGSGLCDSEVEKVDVEMQSTGGSACHSPYVLQGCGRVCCVGSRPAWFPVLLDLCCAVTTAAVHLRRISICFWRAI
jgi:hypothetical protein